MPKFPCYLCLDNCDNSCIHCEICGTWSHFHCQDIDRSDRVQWTKNIKLPYICIRCRTNEDGSYDYLMALERLTKASRNGLQKLTKAAERELMFLKSVPLQNTLHDNFTNKQQDQGANTLLAHFHASNLTALQSSADGDCFFNSVSTLLCGDESRSTELRYRCCIEMLTNRRKIMSHPQFKRLTVLSPPLDKDCVTCAHSGHNSSMHMFIATSHFLNLPIQVVYPAVNGTTNYSFKVMNTLLRPPFADPDKGKLHLMWTSMQLPSTSPTSQNPWVPNHIVPLVSGVDRAPLLEMAKFSQITTKDEALSCVETRNKFQPLGDPNIYKDGVLRKDHVSERKRKLNTPNHKRSGKHPKRDAPHFASTMKHQKSEECETITKEGSHLLWDAAHNAPTAKYPERADDHYARKHQEPEECISATDVDSHPLWDAEFCAPNKQTTETNSDSEGSFSHFPELSVSTEEISDDSLHTNVDFLESASNGKLHSSSLNTSSESETGSCPVSPLTVENGVDYHDSILENSGDTDNYITKLTALPRPGTFMTNEEVIDVIMNTKTPENVVPSGQKDNCYVVLKIEGTDKNKKNDYADDCGVWDWKTATTVNQTFAVEGATGTLKVVYKKNGKYCIKKVIKGEVTYPPLEPQPEHILGMHRYYTKFSSDNNFKKRVTTVTELPESLKDKANFAVVEYCGKMPPNKKKHGNTKASDAAPYIRTNPTMLSRAAQMAKHQKVANVFTELTEEDSFLAPKSTRQINDKIYNENKRKRDTAALGSRVSIADDVAVAIGALNSDPYIQEVVLTKDKKPAVIVYSDEQLTDMKRNCIGDDCSVLGVDRTFNLGRFYVTTISYKNRCVLRKRTNDYPIMFGPCLIHFDAEESTYGKFFSHVSDKIGDAKTVIGSDEEKSMTNALKKKFPNSEFLLCTKHIKDNIRRYLEETGTSLKDREKVLKIIFEEKEGIIYSDSEADFEINCEKLQPFLENNTKFKLYWQKFMYDKLREYVFRPLCKGTVSRAWTNNNSESMNHKLKAAVDWQKSKFPELIQQIGIIMKSQVIHLKCAMFGKGDFKLTKLMQNHFVDPTVWHGLNKTDKNEKFKKFMSAKPKTRLKSKFVKATHIQLQCPVLTDNVGKKPGQRKRQASERTSSFNK